MDKLIIIAGATASSKSATAIEVAKRLDGEIINADSMQIYRGMDIGTAKTCEVEMDNIPHYMLNVVDYKDNFTVAEYAKMTKNIIKDIISRGKTPILSGGTGLYIDSVIYPFDFGQTDNQDDSVKMRLLEELNTYGAQYLHDILAEVDPVDAGKIHPNNTKRLIRALEIYRLTGKTKSQSNNKTLIFDVDMTVLDWEKEILYERINKRVELMFELGLEKEVKELVGGDIGAFDYQSMQAIGYKEFHDYFFGDILLEEVKNNIAQNSRHYAKRQLTWFRKYDFAKWLSPEKAVDYYTNTYQKQSK